MNERLSTDGINATGVLPLMSCASLVGSALPAISIELYGGQMMPWFLAVYETPNPNGKGLASADIASGIARYSGARFDTRAAFQ